VWLILLLHIWRVWCSILKPSCPDWSSSWFFSVLARKFQDSSTSN
jgi:hypothetical protein